MTLIIIFNAILAVAIVSAIVGGHFWAIVSSRPAPATGAVSDSPERLPAGLLVREPAIA